MVRQVSFLFLGRHNAKFSISLSFLHLGLVQSSTPRCFLLPWVADAACCCMLKDRGTERIHFSFLRKQRRSIPASRVSVASEAAEVGASLKSVLNLFVGELLAGNLDPVPRLTTWERRLIGHTAKPTTAAGIDARDTRFRLQSVWKRRKEQCSSKPRKLRQDIRRRNDYGANAMILTHDEHADLNHLAFIHCKCAMKREHMKQLCFKREILRVLHPVKSCVFTLRRVHDIRWCLYAKCPTKNN